MMGGRRPASGAGSYFNASSNPRVAATGRFLGIIDIIHEPLLTPEMIRHEVNKLTKQPLHFIETVPIVRQIVKTVDQADHMPMILVDYRMVDRKMLCPF